MPETSNGIVYPESGDHTRLWEHYQNLAESVDALFAAIPIFATGIIQVTPTAANTTTIVPVTFPEGRFTAAPVVVVSPQGGAPGTGYDAILWVRNITATGCDINYRRANTSSIPVSWVAVQQIA